MDRDKYMSGCELRQFLHISTRKMKYLMDHNYIPHENTGHATHKYLVRRVDAIAFKKRMDDEEGFLSELTGKFPSRTHAAKSMLEPTKENCEAFRQYLTERWASYPDAIPTLEAAELIGIQPQRINEMVRENAFHGVTIGRTQYIAKEELILYAASPARIAKATPGRYKQLLRHFNATMGNQCTN